MASNRKLSEEVQLVWQHIDPSTKDTLVGDSVIQASKYVDVSQFHRVMVVLFRIAGTGSIQNAAIYAATAVSGTGSTQIATSGSTEATGLIGTAAGTNDGGTLGARGAGMIVFDLNVSDIEDTLADASHITARASFATATDELGVLYILSDPRYPQSGLTSTGRGTTA